MGSAEGGQAASSDSGIHQPRRASCQIRLLSEIRSFPP